MTSEVVDNASFFLEMRPNRSLTNKGRRLWLGMIGCTTLLFACAALAVGAWMVLPFAGVEIWILWYAFHLIGQHEGDYEWVRVANQEFCWSRSEGGRTEELRGNRAWARVLLAARNGRVELTLRYQGRMVSVGRMISDEQRQLLCRNLTRVLK